MKFLRNVAVSLVLASLSAPALATVQAWLDRDHVDSGESVQLTLQRDGSGGGEPDLAPLKKDFDVLGTSSGSSVRIVNGRMSSRHQVRITLAPKRDGHLLIPSIRWDGDTSPLLTLTVGGAPSTGPGAQGSSATGHNAHFYLTTSLDSANPYVQAGVTLTVRLYTDEPLQQASLDFPGNGDMLVQRLGKDSQTRETRNGHTYDVVERRYVLFPQRSGDVELPGPVLDAQVPDNRSAPAFGADPFFNRFFGHNPFGGLLGTTRPLHLRGKPIRLTVRPRPAAASGPNWVPARDVTLDATWKPANGQVHAGDPVTLHLSLRATGLNAAALPDLGTQLVLPDGLKAYPDRPKLTDSQGADTIVGKREQDIALIATRGGHYALPAIRLSWWDTVNDRAREVAVPAHTLDILPAAAGTAGAAPPAPSAAAKTAGAAPAVAPTSSAIHLAPNGHAGAAGGPAAAMWRWLSIGLGALWIATLALWWLWSRKRRRDAATVNAVQLPPDPAPRVAEARKRFREAARARHARAARTALLDWARAVWPDDPPRGLHALAARIDDERIRSQIRALDRACYAGDSWDGSALAGSLRELRRAKDAPRAPGRLAELYP